MCQQGAALALVQWEVRAAGSGGSDERGYMYVSMIT